MGFGNLDNGAVRTRMQLYAATITDATLTTQVIHYSRDGQFIDVSGVVLFTGAGAATNFLVALPTGLSFLSSMPGATTTAAGAACLGDAMWFDSGVQYKPALVEYNSSNTVRFVIASVITSDLFGNGDGMKFTFKAPIQGW